MQHDYFELGLQIDHLLAFIFPGLGIGAFYRYGPYAFKDFDDNISVKLTVEFIF